MKKVCPRCGATFECLLEIKKESNKEQKNSGNILW